MAGDPRLTRSRCASPDVHLNDEALAVAAMLLLTRSTFTETIDPNRAFDELTRALEMVALANAPFVRNIAAEIQLNSRVSRLDPEARLARADRLLVSWHRAGDVPRVFNPSRRSSRCSTRIANQATLCSSTRSSTATTFPHRTGAKGVAGERAASWAWPIRTAMAMRPTRAKVGRRRIASAHVHERQASTAAGLGRDHGGREIQRARP